MTTSTAPDLDSFLAERVVIAESEAIFAAFALLNAAGYDDENDPEGMHPVRARVREQLARRTPPDLAAALRAYYRDHSGHATTHTYAVVATATSGPPEFARGPGWSELESAPGYRDLADLPDLLRAFSAAVGVGEMYEEVRGDYRTAIQGQLELVRGEAARAMAYCRVASPAELAGGGHLRRAVVIPNLLESHERALSFVWGDAFYAVEGPQREPGYAPHEFVHSVTNPLSYDPRLRERQTHATPLLAAATRTPLAPAFQGKTVQQFLDECLVRAVVLRYKGSASAPRMEESMWADYRSGYVLLRFFYEQLHEYEKSQAPLRAYYPLMLRRLDPRRELARWEREGRPGTRSG